MSNSFFNHSRTPTSFLDRPPRPGHNGPCHPAQAQRPRKPLCPGGTVVPFRTPVNGSERAENRTPNTPSQYSQDTFLVSRRASCRRGDASRGAGLRHVLPPCVRRGPNRRVHCPGRDGARAPGRFPGTLADPTPGKRPPPCRESRWGTPTPSRTAGPALRMDRPHARREAPDIDAPGRNRREARG